MAEAVFNQLDFDSVRDVLPYLAMGIDAANGEMSVDDEGTLRIHRPYQDSLPVFKEIEKTLHEVPQSSGLKGNLFLNPTWTAHKQLITVHPLGDALRVMTSRREWSILRVPYSTIRTYASLMDADEFFAARKRITAHRKR